MGCVGGAQKKTGLKDNKSAAPAQIQPTQDKSSKDKQGAPQPQPHEQSAIDRAKQHSNFQENTHEKPRSDVHPGHHSFLSENNHPAKPASIIKQPEPIIANPNLEQLIPDRKSGAQSRIISEVRSSIKNQRRSGLGSINQQDEEIREEGQYNFSIPTKGLNLHVQIN